MKILNFYLFVSIAVILTACKGNETTSSMKEPVKVFDLTGKIDENPLYMTLHLFENNTVHGSYVYKDVLYADATYVKGTLKDGQLALQDFSLSGTQLSTFIGTYNDSVFVGRFDVSCDSADFVLEPVIDDNNYHPLDFSMINFDAYKVVATDYALFRQDVKEHPDKYDDYGEDPLASYYDYLYWEESWLSSFEEYVKNFDKNDNEAMLKLGPQMIEVADMAETIVAHGGYQCIYSPWASKLIYRFRKAVETINKKVSGNYREEVEED